MQNGMEVQIKSLKFLNGSESKKQEENKKYVPS